MSRIDFKNGVVRLIDGRRATGTLNSVAANSDITFTEVRTHTNSGDDPIRVRIVNPGTNNASLSISVSGADITINAATNGSAAITTTAALAVAALAASAAAAALVSAVAEGDGSGVLTAIAYQTLTNGYRSLEVVLGEGNFTWSEKKAREYLRNKGRLNTVRDGDEEPVEVKLDSEYEFVTASTGSGTPTPTDVMKQKGEASTWTSTSDDPCEPYSIDIEFEYTPDCANVDREIIMIQMFRHESIDFDPKAGTISFSGKANVTEAEAVRAA